MLGRGSQEETAWGKALRYVGPLRLYLREETAASRADCVPCWPGSQETHLNHLPKGSQSSISQSCLIRKDTA